MIKSLIQIVLKRDEEVTVQVRKSGKQRYARDSSQILVPPIEVGYKVLQSNWNYIPLFNDLR